MLCPEARFHLDAESKKYNERLISEDERPRAKAILVERLKNWRVNDGGLNLLKWIPKQKRRTLERARGIELRTGSNNLRTTQNTDRKKSNLLMSDSEYDFLPSPYASSAASIDKFSHFDLIDHYITSEMKSFMDFVLASQALGLELYELQTGTGIFVPVKSAWWLWWGRNFT